MACPMFQSHHAVKSPEKLQLLMTWADLSGTLYKLE